MQIPQTSTHIRFVTTSKRLGVDSCVDQWRTTKPIAAAQQMDDIDKRTKAPFALRASQVELKCIISLQRRLAPSW